MGYFKELNLTLERVIFLTYLTTKGLYYNHKVALLFKTFVIPIKLISYFFLFFTHTKSSINMK